MNPVRLCTDMPAVRSAPRLREATGRLKLFLRIKKRVKRILQEENVAIMTALYADAFSVKIWRPFAFLNQIK